MTDLSLTLKMEPTLEKDGVERQKPLGEKGAWAENERERELAEIQEEKARVVARGIGAENARRLVCAQEFAPAELAEWIGEAAARCDSAWVAQGLGDEMRALWKEARKPFSSLAGRARALRDMDAVLWNWALGNDFQPLDDCANGGQKAGNEGVIASEEEPLGTRQAFAVWTGAGLLSAPSALTLLEGQPNEAAERERGVCLWARASEAKDGGIQASCPEPGWKTTPRQGSTQSHEEKRGEKGESARATAALGSMRELVLMEEASRRTREGRSWNPEIAAGLQREWEALAQEWARWGVRPDFAAANAWRPFWLGRERQGLVAPGGVGATNAFSLSIQRADAFSQLGRKASDSRIAASERRAALPVLDWMLADAIARAEAKDIAEGERQEKEKALRGARKGARLHFEEPGAHWRARDLLSGSMDKWADFFASLAVWEKESPEWATLIASKAMEGFDGPTQAWAQALAPALEEQATNVAEAIWARKEAVDQRFPSHSTDRAAWEHAVALPWIRCSAIKATVAAQTEREARAAFSARWLAERGSVFLCLGSGWPARLSPGVRPNAFAWGAPSPEARAISAERAAMLGALCESVELALEMEKSKAASAAPDTCGMKPALDSNSGSALEANAEEPRPIRRL